MTRSHYNLCRVIVDVRVTTPAVNPETQFRVTSEGAKSFTSGSSKVIDRLYSEVVSGRMSHTR